MAEDNLTYYSPEPIQVPSQGGGGVTSHSGLTNLNADDHLQYPLADGTRGFSGAVSGVDPTLSTHLATKGYIDTLLTGIEIYHGNLNGLGDDDHTQYMLVDAGRSFSAPVGGIDPTSPSHLATKSYVDSLTIDHGGLSGLGNDDHTHYTLADGTRGFTGEVAGIDPTLGSSLATKDYVDGAVIGDGSSEGELLYWDATTGAWLSTSPSLRFWDANNSLLFNGQAQLLYETSDADSQIMLMAVSNANGAGYVVGNQTAIGVDLGLFDGEGDPFVAALDDASVAGTLITHNGGRGFLKTTFGDLVIQPAGGDVVIGTAASAQAPLHIGDNSTSGSVDAQVVVSRNVDSGTAGNGHCFSDSSLVNRPGVIGYNAFDARYTVTGTYDYDHFASHQDIVTIGTSGTTTNHYGFVTETIVNLGTLLQRDGIRVIDGAGTGTITDQYGVRVDELTFGTNNWAIYTSGTTPSYFGGEVSIDGNLVVDTDLLFVDTAVGGIGVGTTNCNCVVQGISLTPKIIPVVDGPSGAEINFGMKNHADTGFGPLIYSARSRGTAASPTIVQDNDVLLGIHAIGYDGTDGARGGSIEFKVDGTPASNDMPGCIIMRTTPSGSQTPSDALFVGSDQRIGFGGNTSPQAVIDATPATIDSASYSAPNSRVTTVQRNALTGMPTGATVDDSTVGAIFRWDGTFWVQQ